MDRRNLSVLSFINLIMYLLNLFYRERKILIFLLILSNKLPASVSVTLNANINTNSVRATRIRTTAERNKY